MATLRTLECMVALVDHGSMSAAATALHLSQPALSHRIASLEKELGAPVAKRLWRGVRITAVGQGDSRLGGALRAAEQAVRTGQRVAHAAAGTIRISCVETMTVWLLLPVLRQWRSRRPNVRLELSEFINADAMADVVEAGGTDVAFGPRPTRTDAHVEVFGKQEGVVVAALGHPFTGLSSVPFSAFIGEPFVHYHPENGIAVWVDQQAARHGVGEPVLRTRSPRTAAQLAAAGMGVTIVPVSALPSRPAGIIRRLRPVLEAEVVAVVAAPSDMLVRQFVTDVRRRHTALEQRGAFSHRSG